MVASKHEEIFRELDFVAEKQHDALYGIFATIYVVPDE